MCLLEAPLKVSATAFYMNTAACEHVLSHCQYKSCVNALNWD